MKTHPSSTDKFILSIKYSDDYRTSYAYTEKLLYECRTMISISNSFPKLYLLQIATNRTHNYHPNLYLADHYYTILGFGHSINEALINLKRMFVQRIIKKKYDTDTTLDKLFTKEVKVTNGNYIELDKKCLSTGYEN